MVQRGTRALSKIPVADCLAHRAFCAVRKELPIHITSIVESDREFVVNRLHMFGVARNGDGLRDGLLAPRGTGKPHDAILIGIDMNAAQAGQMISGELGFDFRGNRRILHEYRGARPDRFCIVARDGGRRPEQRAE